MSTTNDDPISEAKNWIHDIYFFKTKCHKDLSIIKGDDPILAIKKREVDEEDMDFKS